MDFLVAVDYFQVVFFFNDSQNGAGIVVILRDSPRVSRYSKVTYLPVVDTMVVVGVYI